MYKIFFFKLGLRLFLSVLIYHILAFKAYIYNSQLKFIQNNFKIRWNSRSDMLLIML
jgi:hypothetical protein